MRQPVPAPPPETEGSALQPPPALFASLSTASALLPRTHPSKQTSLPPLQPPPPEIVCVSSAASLRQSRSDPTFCHVYPDQRVGVGKPGILVMCCSGRSSDRFFFLVGAQHAAPFFALTSSQTKRNNYSPASHSLFFRPATPPPSTPQSQSSPESRVRPGCSVLLPPDPAPPAAENR